MPDPIRPANLALLRGLDLGDSPGHVRSAYKALLAEVDRLTAELAKARKQVNDIRHTVSTMLPAYDEPGTPDPGDHWRRVHHALVTEVAWIIAPQDFSERERRLRESRTAEPTAEGDPT
jgi:hypothetical protein